MLYYTKGFLILSPKVTEYEILIICSKTCFNLPKEYATYIYIISDIGSHCYGERQLLFQGKVFIILGKVFIVSGKGSLCFGKRQSLLMGKVVIVSGKGSHCFGEGQSLYRVKVIIVSGKGSHCFRKRYALFWAGLRSRSQSRKEPYFLALGARAGA